MSVTLIQGFQVGENSGHEAAPKLNQKALQAPVEPSHTEKENSLEK